MAELFEARILVCGQQVGRLQVERPMPWTEATRRCFSVLAQQLTGRLPMMITSTPQSCSVFWGTRVPGSVASADNLGDHWWVSRVFVRQDERGRGIGSRLLQALQQACELQGCKELRVIPGGYGEDPRRQAQFYERSGFVKESQAEGDMWVWRVG